VTARQSLAARLVVVAALVAPALAYQGATRAGLTGRLVREGEETHPVRRARVVLTGPATVDADTDTDGVFRIADLPDGTYRVSVKKTGFVLVDPAAIVTVPSSRPLETIAMRPGAVITGRLLNMFGKPVAGVDVSVSRATTDPAAPKDNSAVRATTDDEGTFRLHTLQPGAYNVFAASFYYPGKSARADAEVVRLNAGQTVTLDFQVPWDPPGERPLSPPVAICDVTRFPSNLKAGTGLISGRIKISDPTRSMEKVVVMLSGISTRQTGCAETGPNGAYAFTGIGAGRYYVLAAFHPAGAGPFVSMSYGQRTSQDPLTPITLTPGQQRNTVDITLPARMAVPGRVFDEFGDPAPDVKVGLLQLVALDGKARWTPVARDATTNDLGVFRMPPVEPGSFSVIALSGPFGTDAILDGPMAPQRDLAGFAVTYYPGTTIARDAQLFQVSADGPPPEISFALVPADLGALKGRVTDRFGRPVGQVYLTLYQIQEGDIRAIVPARATADKDGSFLIRNVPMGTYLLEADGPQRYGNLTVAVTEREVGGLSVVMREPVSIRGRLIFEGARDLPSQNEVFLQAYQPNWLAGPVGRRARSSIADDWTFTITGVMGPTRLRVIAPEPWIPARGLNAADAPIDASSGDVSDVEIRMVRAPRTVTGRVVDQDARGVSGAFVLIFAANQSLWSFPSHYVTAVVADDNGTFEAPPLPATTYIAVPFARSPRIDWMNPEYLATLSGRGGTFTVVNGAAAYVPLRLDTRR
jgi:protocatechuate 3,4-dioxygenase beta subunit